MPLFEVRNKRGKLLFLICAENKQKALEMLPKATKLYKKRLERRKR